MTGTGTIQLSGEENMVKLDIENHQFVTSTPIRPQMVRTKYISGDESGSRKAAEAAPRFTFRQNSDDSMLECILNEDEVLSEHLSGNSNQDTVSRDNEGPKVNGTRKSMRRLVFRQHSNDSMPECSLAQGSPFSTPVTPIELQLNPDELSFHEIDEDETLTEPSESFNNPFHEDKELFFTVSKNPKVTIEFAEVTGSQSLGSHTHCDPGRSHIDIGSFISSGLLSPTANKRCQGKKVTVNGKTLALFHYNDQFYAVDERCPHMGGPLHLGDIEDLGGLESPRIVCPWHKWCFELATGKQVRPEGRYYNIQSYPVRIGGSGELLVGFRSLDPACFNMDKDF